MLPVSHASTTKPRARERRARLACAACGQSFTLHYSSVQDGSAAPTAVPCMNDACGCDVEVMLPPGAFAVWVEEF